VERREPQPVLRSAAEKGGRREIAGSKKRRGGGKSGSAKPREEKKKEGLHPMTGNFGHGPWQEESSGKGGGVVYAVLSKKEERPL